MRTTPSTDTKPVGIRAQGDCRARAHTHACVWSWNWPGSYWANTNCLDFISSLKTASCRLTLQRATDKEGLLNPILKREKPKPLAILLCLQGPLTVLDKRYAKAIWRARHRGLFLQNVDTSAAPNDLQRTHYFKWACHRWYKSLQPINQS